MLCEVKVKIFRTTLTNYESELIFKKYEIKAELFWADHSWAELVYKLFIRQGLEFAAPLWTSSLSKKNIKDLEKLQARATDIICGYENRLSYEQRLGVLSLLSLKTRRWAITERFAVDCSKNPKFQHLFKERPYQNTRSKQKYCEIQARTKRYASSPIPTYISLVNKISQN